MAVIAIGFSAPRFFRVGRRLLSLKRTNCGRLKQNNAGDHEKSISAFPGQSASSLKNGFLLFLCAGGRDFVNVAEWVVL